MYARAKRVPLLVPIAYRRAGDEVWLRGRIVNVSESGVMFAPGAVEPGQSIEVMFSTPIPIASIAPGTVLCKGEVVRTSVTGVAAMRFDEFRYVVS